MTVNWGPKTLESTLPRSGGHASTAEASTRPPSLSPLLGLPIADIPDLWASRCLLQLHIVSPLCGVDPALVSARRMQVTALSTHLEDPGKTPLPRSLAPLATCRDSHSFAVEDSTHGVQKLGSGPVFGTTFQPTKHSRLNA